MHVYPTGLIAALGLLLVWLIFVLGLIAQSLLNGREGASEPPVIDPMQALDDLLTRRLSHQTGIAFESENRIRAELLEHGQKLDVLVESIRQNSKEVAVIESLLRDSLQVLNISISEAKTLAHKLQKVIDDGGKPPLPPSAQKLTQAR